MADSADGALLARGVDDSVERFGGLGGSVLWAGFHRCRVLVAMSDTRGMDVRESVALVRRFYAAGPADDDQGRAEFAVSDVVWHVPGDNPVSGRYRGYDEVFRTIGELMQPLDRWELEVRDVMGNDDMAVALVDLVAVRGDHHVSCRGAHVFRFASDGRIAEVWGFVGDQPGLDALFAS